MNTKRHAICDSQGRPMNLFVTAGQVSDDIGARAVLGRLPDVDLLLEDRGYEARCFRKALKDRGIRTCIPGRKKRETAVRYDKRRNRIEIMFGRPSMGWPMCSWGGSQSVPTEAEVKDLHAKIRRLAVENEFLSEGLKR